MSMGSGASAAFIMILPGEGEDGAGDPGESPRSAPAAESAAGEPAARARILLVEDDFLVGMEVEAGLAEAGYEVTGIAASAEEAVMLAEAGRPDLVVMDIRLAGERDGVDAALEIHRRLGIRSVFASAHGDIATRTRAAAAMPAGWIDKPYRVPALVAAVAKALASLDNGPKPEPRPDR